MRCLLQKGVTLLHHQSYNITAEYIYIYIPKWGRKQRMGDLEVECSGSKDLEVECGGSSVYRVMVSIKEDSNVHNNLHIKI